MTLGWSMLRLMLAVLAAGLAVPAPAQLYFTPRRAIQAQCTYNHECADGLICSNGYCRAECATDRDCAGGQSCVIDPFTEADGPRSGKGTGAETPGVGRAAAATGQHGGHCRAVQNGDYAQSSGPVRQTPVPVILPGTAVVTEPLTVTAVKVVANRPVIKDKCPVTVGFSAWITASASGAVTWRIVRSDGATGAVHTLKFGSAGQQPISEVWSLSTSLTGSITLEVLSPTPITSAPATFRLDCLQ